MTPARKAPWEEKYDSAPPFCTFTIVNGFTYNISNINKRNDERVKFKY